MEDDRSAFKILTGNPRGKRPLVRPRLRWEDDIIMDIKQIGINTRKWVYSAQDRDYWRTLDESIIYSSGVLINKYV